MLRFRPVTAPASAVRRLSLSVMLAVTVVGCSGTRDAVCGDDVAEAVGLLVITGACGALWVADETTRHAERAAARIAGIEQAHASRLTWLRRDASNGDDEAAYRLAVQLAFDQDPDAIRWACSAASNGHRPARVLLASWFAPERFESRVRPEQIVPDLRFSYVWYTLATDRSDSNSENFRQRLGAELTARQRTEAERFLSEWRPGLCPAPVQP